VQSLARVVLRHRFLVLAAWVAVLAAGIPNLERATGAFSQTFAVPGREGFETNEAILERYGVDTLTDAIVPVTRLDGRAEDARAELAQAESALRRALPGALVAGYGSTGDRAFLSDDGASSRTRGSTRASARWSRHARRSAPARSTGT
jgi:putative drug exporter of the RND superfamily